MRLQPMGDYVLLEPLKREEKTESGFYLPTDEKEKPEKGKVVDLGAEVATRGIIPGTVVHFKQYSGETIEFEGKEYIALHFDAIICVENEV